MAWPYDNEPDDLQAQLLGAVQPQPGPLPQFPAPEAITGAVSPQPTIEPPGGGPAPPPITMPGQPEPMPGVLPDPNVYTPPMPPPPTPMPGGGIDPDAFNQMFGQAFQQYMSPVQQQMQEFQTQLGGFGEQIGGIPGVDLSGLTGGQQSLMDMLASLQTGQAGIGEQIGGIPQVDLSAINEQLGGLSTTLGGLQGNISGALGTQVSDLQTMLQNQISGIPTGLTPEQLQAALQSTQEAITNQMTGQQTAGSEQFTGLQTQLTDLMDYFNQQQAGGQVPGGAPVTPGLPGAGGAPQQTTFSEEQLANVFGGTQDQYQMPGFMYGPDYFRAGTDYMTELAAGAPAQDVMGAMGDVLGAGPASYGQMGETLAQRLTSPSVYEGELGGEMLGMIRGMSNIDTAPYQQLMQSGMSRIGEAEQRAIDQEMLRFNRMGLTPENVASGTIIDPLSRMRERYAQTRGDLMSQLSLQQGQREDVMRQAQAGAMGGMLGGTQAGRMAGTQGLQQLLGLQQAGQAQTVGGLGGLAGMLQQQQAQQVGALGGIQQQAFGQNMADIGLQRQLMMDEQQRQAQLYNTMLGQTQPTFPTIPSTGQQPQQQGGGFWGGLGSSLPYLPFLMQQMNQGGGGGGQ